MKKFIGLIILFNFYLTAQDIYYQKDFITILKDEPIAINEDNLTFNVFKGVVSKDNKYIAGFLADSSILNFINWLKMDGILETIAPEKNKIILYSQIDRKILLVKEVEYLPDIFFIEDNLVINYWDNRIEVINLKSNDCKEYSLDDNNEKFSIYNDNIYLLKEKEGKTIINKYDFCSTDFSYFSQVTNVSADVVYIIENKIIVKADSESQKTLLVKSTSDNVIKQFYFESINYLLNSKELFIVGEKNSKGTFLYKYLNKDNDIEELFPLHSGATQELFILQISAAFSEDDSIIFSVRSLLPENENVIIYNTRTKTFQNTTFEGYVSPPLGIVKSGLN